MSLSNLDPSDNFLQVETKLDAVIDELNNNRFIKYSVINIGDWDMDTDQFTGSIAHGISDHTKIRSIDIMIRDDSWLILTPLDIFVIAGFTGGGVQGLSSTNIVLGRVTAGYYDSTTYDATSFNRGFITIGYIE